MRQSAKIFAFFLLVAIGAAGRYAQAANLTVNCDKTRNHSRNPATACECQSARAEYDNCCRAVAKRT